ncbi:hypothetical protein GQL56_28815, partial [Pseudomonas putida]|nr:hypothetical protein [Pseudomonas putida]
MEQSDEQPLALCYGNDPNVEGGSDDELVAQKSKQASKAKTKTKTTSKKPKADDCALICNGEEPTRLREKFEEL